ncbi:MAG TPA: hypothetical protein VMU39_02560 [Solirubrobacteraceae bacterium]|nr:hypothetical protein [Solirubrobacteraceae bacterium]
MNLRPMIGTARAAVGSNPVAAAISWLGFDGSGSSSGRALRRAATCLLGVFALGFAWGALRVLVRSSGFVP